jgi:voltage-gated potassium channel
MDESAQSEQQMSSAPGRRAMRWNPEGIFDLLDAKATGPGAKIARLAHQIGIGLGVAIMVLASEASVRARFGAAIDPIFWAIAVLFAIEYGLRLALAPWAHWAHRGEHWWSRVHFATSFLGLVDLAATCPLVALGAGMQPENAELFGALWLIKLTPYADGLELVGRVLRTARGPLLSLFLGFMMVMLLAGTLAHLFESEAQPESFGSIPRALWWAIATLTTVGYGDAVPVTVAGRLLGGVVMICGIGVFALWAGILATTFSDEMRRRAFLKTWDLVAHVPYFNGLGAGLIAEVARLLRAWEVTAGTTVMRRGQPGDCMYFIASGEVSVKLAPQPLTLEEGSFFGEIAIITGEPRSATAVAETDCQLLILDLADFRDLAGRHPDLTAAIDAEAKRRRMQIAGGAGPGALVNPAGFGPA